MRKKILQPRCFAAFFILALIAPLIASAIPVPHGIEGRILELDGITEVKSGTFFSVSDITNGQSIEGQTGRGSPGRYSVALKGDDGDEIVIRAWNAENAASITLALNGVMRNVNFILNTSLSPMPPEIISAPVTSAIANEPYQYKVEAFDGNDDELFYSLEEHPNGMSIDEQGLISWNPASSDNGTHPITVLVTDGIFNVTQSYALEVINPNLAPEIISVPVTNAVQDANYLYDVQAIDADNDTLSYILEQFPDGMSISHETGLINWTPTALQIGLHSVKVTATDGLLNSSQDFMINVSNLNDLPIITSIPNQNAVEVQLYSYDVDAFDIDNDTLSYSLLSKPQGMQINSLNGYITWTPSFQDSGLHNVTVKVSDNDGFAVQSYSIMVQNTNTAPVINSTPVTIAIAGRNYMYDVDAYDMENDTIRFNLTQKPGNMKIDMATGIIKWKPGSRKIGNHTVIVEASDGSLKSYQQYVLRVIGKNQLSQLSANMQAALASETAADSEILEIDDGIEDEQALSIQELKERPKGTKLFTRRVFKYLKIEKTKDINNDEHEINFTVPLYWISGKRLNESDIILSRFNQGQWKDLPTEFISKDKQYASYRAKTPGFSYFAINVKEGIKVAEEIKPVISKINAPFRVSGFVYRFGRFVQARNVEVKITNVNTNKAFETTTGMGPFNGMYYINVYGNKNDAIKVRLNGIEREFSTKLSDIDNLDFTINLWGTDFSLAQKTKTHSFIVGFAIPLAAGLLLAVIMVIRKKMKK